MFFWAEPDKWDYKEESLVGYIKPSRVEFKPRPALNTVM
jgi:hypothetical protein